MAKTDKTKLSIAIPPDMKEWIEKESEKIGVSQSSIILFAIKTYIDQQMMLEMSRSIDDIQLQLKQKI